MSKILLVIALVLGAAGCEMPERPPVDNAPITRDAWNGMIKTIEYDSCEYVLTAVHNGNAITHKGNCKNCRKFAKENK